MYNINNFISVYSLCLEKQHYKPQYEHHSVVSLAVIDVADVCDCTNIPVTDFK